MFVRLSVVCLSDVWCLMSRSDRHLNHLDRQSSKQLLTDLCCVRRRQRKQNHHWTYVGGRGQNTLSVLPFFKSLNLFKNQFVLFEWVMFCALCVLRSRPFGATLPCRCNLVYFLVKVKYFRHPTKNQCFRCFFLILVHQAKKLFTLLCDFPSYFDGYRRIFNNILPLTIF